MPITQFLVAIKIYKLYFLKKLLFRYTSLLSRLVLSSHMGDKPHICWKDRGRLYALPITPLNTRLRFSSTTKAENKMYTHTLKNNTDYFKHPSPKPFRMFPVPSLWGPWKQIPALKPYPEELQSPMNGRAQSIPQPSAAVAEKGAVLCNRPALDRLPSFLSCGGENLFSVNNFAPCPSRRRCVSVWPQRVRHISKVFRLPCEIK